MKRRTFAAWPLWALASGAGLVPGLAKAQANYPSKPLKFIVPYAAGGLPDTVARVVAQRLGERLGQAVIVDNRAGGNGITAYQALLQSSPQDGYTFIVSDGSMLSITPFLNKQVPYHIGKELLPVSLIARSPLYLVAHPRTGVNNFADFVKLVKSKPDEFTYGSSGIGSTHHMTMEALKAALDLHVRHIPFKGSGQSTPALVGGQVDFSIAALPSIQGFVKTNQVKVLASNALKRSAQLPDIPAIAETVAGFDFAVAIGVMAAAGTPQFAIDRVGKEIAEVMKNPDLIKTLENLSIDPVGAGAPEYGRVIALENEAMAKAAKAADLKAE